MNTLLLFITIMYSCNGNNSRSTLALDAEVPVANMSLHEGEFDLEIPPTDQPTSSTTAVERKLIRNGQLEFQTEEVKKTKIEIDKICKELNAYVSSESENNYEDKLQYDQTIRVPANKFDALLLHIESLALKIETKNINTEDVTEDFIDVDARLKTKKELEVRYNEILKQAKMVEEIISIESQIANVRSEIESIQGRLNYLNNQIAYSTLSITYYETIGTDFGFASKLVQSIKGGWDNLLTFIIFLMNLWPFVIGIVVLLFWFLKRRINRKHSNIS